ncbi:hypothetical protein [Candidatus Avelusimicrobium sp.]
MKKIFTFLLFLMPLTLMAQADKEPFFYVDDFLNQSVIHVEGDRDYGRCQALRLSDEWYLTAAHCVYPACKRECDVVVELIQHPALKAQVEVRHRSSDPKVFVPREYEPKRNKSIRSDMALIKIEPLPTNHYFFSAEEESQIDYPMFLEKLQSSKFSRLRQQWNALHGQRATLLTIEGSVARHLQQPIAVPVFSGADIFYQESFGQNFFYFPQLRYYMGKNFGVEKGMSGSGVIIPGGKAVGVVSANLEGSGQIVSYNEADQPISVLPYDVSFFFFTPFTPKNKNFIEATLESQGTKRSNRPYFAKIGAHNAAMVDLKVEEAFEDAPSVQDIEDTNLR